MSNYFCDTSGNGLFYWAAHDLSFLPVDPAHGGRAGIVSTHKDGTYGIVWPDGSSDSGIAPDYVDPGCTPVGGGVYLPTAYVAPPLSLAQPAQVTETVTPELCISVSAIGTAPYGYQLAQTERFAPTSISAQWDGTGAGGSFLPCIALYSSSGHLIGRTFPGQTLAAGDKAEVTYAPF